MTTDFGTTAGGTPHRDAERVAAVLGKAGADGRTVHAEKAGAGTTLECAECGGAVQLKSPHSGRPPTVFSPDPSFGSYYICVECRSGALPAQVVNRELQELVEEKWQSTAWRRNWYAPALREADESIAEARAAYEWCADERRRRLVARALRRRTRHPDLRWNLFRLGKYTVAQVERRTAIAELSGFDISPDAPPLAALQEAEHAYGSMFLSGWHRPNRLLRSRSYNETARVLAERLGGRRELRAYIEDLQDELWSMLAEPVWRAPDTSVLREVAALDEDWGNVSDYAMNTLRPLITAATGHGRLVLSAHRPGGTHLRVIPRDEPDHG